MGHCLRCSSAGSEDISAAIFLPCTGPARVSQPELSRGAGLCLLSLHRAIPSLGVTPLSPQSLGRKHRGGSEHADPPQRGRAAPEVQQWADGDVLQGQVHRRVGHGVPHGHHAAPRAGGTPRRRQRGGLR